MTNKIRDYPHQNGGVVCFAALVETVLLAVWAEQHAPYTRFMLRSARKESNTATPNRKEQNAGMEILL